MDAPDLGLLRTGDDLVLRLAEADAGELPAGAAADDHLDRADREALDSAAVTTLEAWRAAFDEPLTVDGICLPFIVEWQLMQVLMATLRSGAGLLAAVRRLAPNALVPATHDAPTRALVAAVGAQTGVPVLDEPEVTVRAPRPAGPQTPRPRFQDARRSAIQSVLRAGAPGFLRRGSVLALSYWPLEPVIDRLLEQDGVRVAIPLRKPPTGPRRGLRCMADGGWIGIPGPLARRRAARGMASRLRAARALPVPVLPDAGFDAGPAIHGALLDRVADLSVDLLAMGSLARRSYERSRPGLILATQDVEPLDRLLVTEARRAGIKVLELAHGAYVMPQTLKDMELADVAAIYTEAVGFPGMRRDRPVHEVGYPLPVPAQPPAGGSPRTCGSHRGAGAQRASVHLAVRRTRGARSLSAGPVRAGPRGPGR